MSLNFNFSKVHDYAEVTTAPGDPERWHPVADALVWLSMICGYNKITEDNLEKVTRRIMAFQVVRGAYLGGQMASGYVKIHITPADVRRFIGMTTNASTMTDAQWASRLGKMAMDEGGFLHTRLSVPEQPTALAEVQRVYDSAKKP